MPEEMQNSENAKKPRKKRRKTTRSIQRKTADDALSSTGTTSERFSENIEYRGNIYTKHNYFLDQKRKVDFVLVSSILKTSEELDKLVTYVVNLMAQGVEYEISSGKALTELVFIKLHCPLPVLQHHANIYNILFDFQHPRDVPNVEEGWYHCKLFNNVTTHPDTLHPDYPRAISSLSHTKQKAITSWERSLIMEKILAKTQFGPLAKEKGLKKLKEAKILIDAFPTHDGPWEYRETGPLTDRQLLSKYWANLSCIFKNQPINLIYKYYGPEVAFYFAFVDYYTKMLTLPALLGVLCFIYNAMYIIYIDSDQITEVCSSNIVLCAECYDAHQCDFNPVRHLCYAAKYNVLFDNIGGIGFAILISIWATVFLELWLRREFVYKFHWNLLNSQVDMAQRIEFTQKTKHTRISPVSGERVNYVPCHVKFFKYSFTLICFLLMIGVIFLCLACVIYTRLSLHRLITQTNSKPLKKYKDLISISITALMAIIFVHLLSPQFLKLTQFLTNEENPPSMLEYYNSCTYKFYIVSFFNHYVPIFYVALLRGAFYTYPGDLKNYEFFGWRTDVCTAVGCSFATTLFLMYFLSSKLIVMRTYYLLKIGIMKIFRKKRRKLSELTKRRLPAWERDYLLQTCGELFLMTDFMDVVIQYGFVIFFIAGLPLSPVMVLIMNIVRVRLDARRILRQYRRPVAKVLPGIGSWNSILRLVTFIGAITNALVIAVTSDLIDMEVYRNSYGSLHGFMNGSFSDFAVKDYPAEFDSLLKKYPSVEMCAYRARRNPSHHDEKYEFTEEQWKMTCYKLCFVLIFQQMIWLLSAICSNIISTIPDEVREELNDEALKVREYRFEAIGRNFYGPHADIPASSFKID